jgi:6,7-dimethyl-8-ribityllumazine synthase
MTMRDIRPEFSIQEASSLKIAIITATWNQLYNMEMYESGRETLEAAGVKTIDRFEAPGAFEIPLLAQKLAETGKYNAVICYGTVVRGDTRHFKIVADESARGVMDVMLKTGVPILNGILACENAGQAEFRASRKKEDKGKEVALSALALLHQLSKLLK